MLRFEDVSVKFGSSTVLSDVSFTLSTGKLTALVGKNGSGKSTLAACLRGQIAFSGDILVEGVSFKEIPARQRAKQLACLPQILPFGALSVRQLVQLGRNPYLGLTRRFGPADHMAVEQALTDTDMYGFAERDIRTLSGGERQRAFLAMLLAQDTPLLILDEPTAYMDIQAEAQFLELLRTLTRRGKTVLAILHNLEAAMRFGDDIVVLDQGRVMFAGSKEECRKQEKIEEVFGVQRLHIQDKDFFFAQR